MKRYAVTVTRVVVEETTMHIDASCAAEARRFGRQDAKHAHYNAVDVTYCPDVIACELVPATLAPLVPIRASQASRASDAGTRPSAAGAGA